MTISKEQALKLLAPKWDTIFESHDIAALREYIESVDSDTSIRAELRRAAMHISPWSFIQDLSDQAWDLADRWCPEGMGRLGNDELSNFLLMVAEAL